MGIIQRAWKRSGADWTDLSRAVPRLHGWVYDIRASRLRSGPVFWRVVEISLCLTDTGRMKDIPIDLSTIPEIYRLKFDDPLHPLPPGLHSYDLD